MTVHRPAREWWLLVKRSVSAWMDDYAPSMGAALSYYTVFSLAPMLLIVIAVAGLIFGHDAARGALFEQLSTLMGADAAKAVQSILAGASRPSQGILATSLGVVVLLVGATSVFGELQDALNRIWRAPDRPAGGGLWGLLRARLLSFGMILGIAFLLMVALVVDTAVSALGKWWSPIFGGWEVLAHALTFLFGLVVTTSGFAMIYKFMPRVTVRWHDVWIGAFVTAVLFSLGRLLIGLYIGKSGLATTFGAAGSLVIVFVWVYYSAQIFLLGAEFTWVFATTYGSMKGLAQREAAPCTELPSRSAGPPPPVARPHALAPATPGPALSPARAAARDLGSPQAFPTLGVVGGLAAGAALRYALPWLLRRAMRR